MENPVDTFRNNYFENYIQVEKAKEKAKELAQKKCFHNYNIQSVVHQTGYQQRTCSKCGRSDIKLLQVWEGTKNGTCSIC